MKRMALAALAAAAVLSLSACGGGGSGEITFEEHLASGVTGIPDGVPWVNQDNLRFVPGGVLAKVGEPVYFKNSETAIHTVNIAGRNESGTMKRNDVFRWTFTEAGDFRITCDFHPQMKSSIRVKPATE